MAANMRTVLYFVIFCFLENAVDAGPKVCHACAENDEATCIANQFSQTCATDRNSLGTTHCGSAVGVYRDWYGQVRTGVIRGCIDCADKKAACFALGGALKARAFWILLKCEMDCCTESNCNTQTPTLTQAAITVFTPDAAGPSQCYACAERDAATCRANLFTQTCATDQSSLGTTHCGSAVGKYQDKSGKVLDGFIRGCIQCADKKAACFAFGGALKAREFWTVLKCEIECCTADYCNTQTPTLSRNAITVFSPEGSDSSGHQVLFSTRVLALALAFGNILYHFC